MTATARRQHHDGTTRARPGTKGGGRYYRIEVRPKGDFSTYRYHDVGDPGKIQRLAGKRPGGSWDDQAWLIEKDMAHIENGELVADDPEAKAVLEAIGPAKHQQGDIFRGQPRRDIPEREKPTPAQRRARQNNIAKAQAVRSKQPR